jgi:hypothetical protein
MQSILRRTVRTIIAKPIAQGRPRAPVAITSFWDAFCDNSEFRHCYNDSPYAAEAMERSETREKISRRGPRRKTMPHILTCITSCPGSFGVQRYLRSSLSVRGSHDLAYELPCTHTTVSRNAVPKTVCCRRQICPSGDLFETRAPRSFQC